MNRSKLPGYKNSNIVLLDRLPSDSQGSEQCVRSKTCVNDRRLRHENNTSNSHILLANIFCSFRVSFSAFAIPRLRDGYPCPTPWLRKVLVHSARSAGDGLHLHTHTSVARLLLLLTFHWQKWLKIPSKMNVKTHKHLLFCRWRNPRPTGCPITPKTNGKSPRVRSSWSARSGTVSSARCGRDYGTTPHLLPSKHSSQVSARFCSFSIVCFSQFRGSISCQQTN